MKIGVEHRLEKAGYKFKDHFRDCLAEISQVTQSVHMEIGSRLFYGWKGFEKQPHGTEYNVNKHLIEKAMKMVGNGRIGSEVLNISHKNNISCNNLKAAYPGSDYINAFEALNISHNSWLHFILEKGERHDSRDDEMLGFTKRLKFGYVQKQCSFHPKAEFFKTYKMPYRGFPSEKQKHVLPDNLRSEAANIMSLGQDILDKMYTKDNIMNDELRNDLFGYRFGKSYHESCTARFEFFTVIVEWKSILNRHVDYLNDTDDFYNYGCSYSYLIVNKAFHQLYRVNFIMTSREECGKFMKKLRNKI